VPFNFLARMHFLACLECGQNLTAQFVNSIVEKLRKPCKKWKVPDLVSIEEGWDEEKPRDYALNIVATAFQLVLRERDQLRKQFREAMSGD
jgi:hypothetical protein